jgi:hypothetical protein
LEEFGEHGWAEVRQRVGQLKEDLPRRNWGAHLAGDHGAPGTETVMA